MRVTESVIAFDYLTSLNKTRERLVKLQTDLATGKRVLKPSDDPLAADMILKLNSAIFRNEQYSKNIVDAESTLEMTASSLDSFAGVLLDVKETITRGANGTQEEALPTYADKLDQILSEAVNIANTKYNGKYIFGGTQTLDQPFTLASDRSAVTANPNGISGAISYPVGEGLNQVVNIDGESAFQGTQMFSEIIRMRDALRAGNIPSAGDIESVSAMIDHIVGKGSIAGSILQNLNVLNQHIEEQHTQLQSLLSVQQDTDVAEAAMKLKHEEIMLDAALTTGARILPKSLVDFMS
jgi:flagellar hook-associated protein 3 FlgL